MQAFLADRHVDVIDVARGAAPGTRRLVVGDKRTGRATHVVSVAVAPDAGARVEAEARHLEELRLLVRPALTMSLPSVVARVEVSGRPGLVLSAVPGVGPRGARSPAALMDEAIRVRAWLTMMWSDTAREPAPVDFGSQAYDVLLARFAGSRRRRSRSVPYNARVLPWPTGRSHGWRATGACALATSGWVTVAQSAPTTGGGQPSTPTR